MNISNFVWSIWTLSITCFLQGSFHKTIFRPLPLGWLETKTWFACNGKAKDWSKWEFDNQSSQEWNHIYLISLSHYSQHNFLSLNCTTNQQCLVSYSLVLVSLPTILHIPDFGKFVHLSSSLDTHSYSNVVVTCYTIVTCCKCSSTFETWI